MKIKFIILLLFPCVLFFTKCQKAPDFPATPVISFVKFNQTQIRPDKDSLKITFSFTDGDGDLGSEQGQNTTGDIFVTDVRVGKANYTYSFNMPYITPKGSYKQISGNYIIDMIGDCHCRPDHTIADTVSYLINIQDRAGHVSNTITTPKVYLSCN
jgi:hypothetical protein